MSEHMTEVLEGSEREIVVSRLFDAPRELVFDAWMHPDRIGQWWGPDGFTTTTHEMDVRPGGVWRYIMHGPDGTDYKNKIVYEEVVRPERLVYAHGGEDETDHIQFHVTVTFEQRGDQTLITMRSRFETAALRDMVVKEFGAIEGAKQNLARLAGYVAHVSIG